MSHLNAYVHQTKLELWKMLLYKSLQGHALKKWQEGLKSLLRSLWRWRVILLVVTYKDRLPEPLTRSRFTCQKYYIWASILQTLSRYDGIKAHPCLIHKQCYILHRCQIYQILCSELLLALIFLTLCNTNII